MHPGKSSWREWYLRLAVMAGAVVVTGTETLGAMHALTRATLIAAWLLAILGGAFLFRRERIAFERPSLLDGLLITAIAAILAIIGFIALLSPPNSADAMSYHLPRVLFWAQQHSVAFFATPYLNQIMLQPFAEYFMLQTYLISGGDHFVNLVQWFGCLTSVIGVSLIAKQFGAGTRGQTIAALVCATVPNGILQASGAKNDYLLSAWLVAAVYFFAGYFVSPKEKQRGPAIFAGVALGLALGTKATAYLYAAPLLLVIAIPLLRRWKDAAIIALCALALNAPQYLRNLQLSGSPLGFDAAFGDGRFRWRNETLGWRQTASNVIRNSTEQLGARSERWNQSVYQAASRMHEWIGAGLDDPATTWPWSKYEPPRNANHEANAANPWHLLILAMCFLALPSKAEWRRFLPYAIALLAGFVLFCFYLKWQPFMARMFLPLFVLASPIAGVVLEKIRPAAVPLLLCLFLVNGARPYLFENWVRPLKGPHSLLHTSRDSNYFSDMGQWNNRESYLEAVNAAAALPCSNIGIDINDLQLEYPFEALLLERNPRARFVHTGVANVSIRYQRPPTPCAVLCLDCAGNPDRIRPYQAFPSARVFGRFILFSDLR
jgi:hypothetical protein